MDSSQRIRAAMLRKSVPGRGPFTMGDLVYFHKRQGGKSGWKWFEPVRVIGQEGRGTLWICHGGIPMTVSVEQRRHATGGEMMAKRMRELKPSRKRRREDMAARPLQKKLNSFKMMIPFLTTLLEWEARQPVTSRASSISTTTSATTRPRLFHRVPR